MCLGPQADALLHGHSYTANPVACSAAVHALQAYQHMTPSGGLSGCPCPQQRVRAAELMMRSRKVDTLQTYTDKQE